MKSKQFIEEVNMKAFKLFRAVILLGGLLLSACAGAPASQTVPSAGSAGSDKAISEVVFTGAIESMNGDQWVINGQTVTVDPSVLGDGPFVIGDTVKVEAQVVEDGSVTAQRVESSSAADIAESATSTPEAGFPGTPVVFNEDGMEAVGAVEAMTDTSITIGGQTYTLAQGAEIKGVITVGTLVKLHFITSADGSLSIQEVEIADPTQVSNGNDNADDNSNDANVNEDSSNHDSNDDNSNGTNVNDDNSNHNGNDDNGGDDNGKDDNSNDNNGNG
jgi:hypothetical protein